MTVAFGSVEAVVSYGYSIMKMALKKMVTIFAVLVGVRLRNMIICRRGMSKGNVETAKGD
jgi:hypothetical protein